jgi:outer membrane protein assembly factor BamB
MLWLRALTVLLLFCAAARSDDWPQWLGPHRDASSPEKITPWTEPPKVLWKFPIEEGHSSPVVAGGKVFVLAKVKDKDEEEVVALEADSGRELWRTPYPRAPFTSLFGNGPRATPAVVDGHVYAFGVTGVLTCLEANTGRKVWQVDTLKQFQAPNLKFGMSCSPLVDDQRVYVNVGGKGASVVAFDRNDGKVLWKTLDDRASYSSPIFYDDGKERQVVFFTEEGLVGLEPKVGRLLWRFPFKDLLSESSTTPVRAGKLLLGSSVTAGSVGLRLENKDESTAAVAAWKNPALTCYFSTPVPVGSDQVYMVTGTIIPPPRATLNCVETSTGKVLWRKEKISKYHASLLRTGDDKLLMLEEAGSLVLLDPNPKEYKELARSQVCGETWAHPALADGRLYVRDAKEVVCLQLPSPGRGGSR